MKTPEELAIRAAIRLADKLGIKTEHTGTPFTFNASGNGHHLDGERLIYVGVDDYAKYPRLKHTGRSLIVMRINPREGIAVGEPEGDWLASLTAAGITV